MRATVLVLVVVLGLSSFVLAAGTPAPQPTHPLPPDWYTYLVYEQDPIVAMDMDIDAAGLPHVAFATYVENTTSYEAYDVTLRYARWGGGSWVTEDLVTAFVGVLNLYASVEVAIKVDGTGQPDLYFYTICCDLPSGKQSGLYHFRPLPMGGWESARLGGTGWRLLEAAEADGVRAAVYHPPTGVFYVESDGAWAPPVQIAAFPVDSRGCIGSSAALAFDPAGDPHVVYGGDNRLYHAVRTADAWTSEVVADFGPDCVWFNGVGLTFDASGAIHIAASPTTFPGTETKVFYYLRDGETWASEKVYRTTMWCTAPWGACASTRLALDSLGTPYLAFTSFNYDWIALAHRHDDGWEQNPLPFLPAWPDQAGFDFSFRIDDVAHFAWMPRDFHALYYSTQRALGADNAPLPPRILAAALAPSGTEPTAGQDVVLTWALSADDGGRENDVQGYEVRAAERYDATGDSYAVLASLPAGTTGYAHVGAGADGRTYHYQVRAMERDTGRWTPAGEQAAKLVRSLAAGWNLVSVPLRLEDDSVDSVFGSLPWNLARTYDAAVGTWRAVDRARGTAGFDRLDRTSAVWLDVGAATPWVLVGVVPWRGEVPLVEGWNLVAYPGIAPQTVAQALRGLPYATVEGFADVPPYYLRTLAPADLMEPGDGYWIRATAGAAWSLAN